MVFLPSDLPTGVFQLITDELASDADFLLHQSLVTHSKEQRHAHRVVVSASIPWAKWHAIALKQSVNLTQQKTDGTLAFIEAGDLSLKDIFSQIARNLSSGALVIIDDVSTLEWIGHSRLSIVRFCRAVRAQCIKNAATLLVRHHILTPDEPDELFQELLQLAAYHLDVKCLSSGRSGAVSGEISLHLGPLVPPAHSVKPIMRSQAIQYRLNDAAAVYFERGHSQGVL
ncbi:hypothetical protein CYLTODRAFT_417274 [Cylindrobasidium torrendii FP15055 ss-10]|uniref:Uncharacterized protein n=1 Tax=Cylindrobasidium torrendii FP15055 ss-10 TaxID=1314674 RepID=A0A0D7BRY9_9AGAR|nr:hypothetical protein CYLTODRAFT_417274 [Cylindrobasidium torrendii FP15055 ss-10]